MEYDLPGISWKFKAIVRIVHKKDPDEWPGSAEASHFHHQLMPEMQAFQVINSTILLKGGKPLEQERFSLPETRLTTEIHPFPGHNS